MSEPDEHVAEMFHGLISDLQRADVEQFDAVQKKEREARAALRAEQGGGLSAGELLKKIDGDPAADQRRIEDELAKITRDAQATVAAAKKEHDAATAKGAHFPPPPSSD